MKVILRRDPAVPVATVWAWVSVGSVNESVETGGLSHVVEHMAFKGTPSRGVGEISRQIESRGGVINAFTGNYATAYFVSLPRRHIGLALEVLGDALGSALFDPDELARELEVIGEEIRMRDDQPQSRLWESAAGAVYTVHCLGRPIAGNREVVKGFTRQQVLEHYRRYYTPRNTRVVVVGDVEPEEILPEVERCFSGYDRPYREPTPSPGEPEQGRWRLVIEEMPVHRAHLALAWPAPGQLHHHTPALDLLAGLAGQGLSSRLYRRVKEELNLVEDISATLFTGDDAGFFYVDCELEPEDVPRALDAALGEIALLRERAVDSRELNRVRNAVEHDYLRERETVEGQAHELALYDHLGDWRRAEEYLERLYAADAPSVLEASQLYLAPERLTVALVVPPDWAAKLEGLEPRADKPSAASYAPGEPSAASYAPGKPSAASYAPGKPSAASYAPGEPSAASYAPGKPSEASYAPGEPSAASYAPGEPSAASYAPGKSSPPPPQTPPKELPPVPLRAAPVEVEELRLADGVRLVLRHNPGRALVSMAAFAAGGLFEEPPELEGATCLALEMALRGTRERDAREFHALVEYYGAELDPVVRRDYCGLTLSCASRHADYALELFAETLLRPAFPEKELEPKRRDILAQISTRTDNAPAYALGLANLALHGGRGYGRFLEGREETVRAMDAARLAEWYNGRVKAERLVIGVSGAFERGPLLERLESLFGALPAGGGEPVPPPHITPTRSIVERLPKQQTHLALAFTAPPLGDDRRFAARVLAQALGGAGGRLFVELRDRLNLAYTVFFIYRPLRWAGGFFSYLATRPGRGDEALAALEKELGRVAREGLGPGEVSRAKENVIGLFQLGRQRNDAAVSAYTGAVVQGRGAKDVDLYPERIAAVTPEEVNALAAEFLEPSGAVRCILRGTLPERLEPSSGASG